jgi:hypothetical protein
LKSPTKPKDCSGGKTKLTPIGFKFFDPNPNPQHEYTKLIIYPNLDRFHWSKFQYSIFFFNKNNSKILNKRIEMNNIEIAKTNILIYQQTTYYSLIKVTNPMEVHMLKSSKRDES